MGDISNEPSMEEILSSIKKIIAEDSVAKVAPRRHLPRESAPRDVAPRDSVREDKIVARVLVADPIEDEDEVLELTEDAPEDAADLVSTVAAEASRTALASLTKVVAKPEIAADNSIEGVVRDMLRPMLKDWLDNNLPGIVEGIVAREVARISGRPL